MNDSASPVETPIIEAGQKAPRFDLPATGGRIASSHDLLGQRFLVYFYPKADTSGCTVQACAIQENLAVFNSLHLPVIGISPDPITPIERFAQKYNLEFPLASDADHRTAEQYGVWKQKSMYGRRYWGIERTSFLIDAKGIVEHVWHKVKPAQHVPDVLAYIRRG